MMIRLHFILLTLASLLLTAGWAQGQDEDKLPFFLDARKEYQTTIRYDGSDGSPLPKPPKDVFKKIKYKSVVGELGAYITPDPKDGKKHPAIIWMTGGFSNSLGQMWGENPRSNDQSAAAYREAGVVMMLPSLRGGNDNPGQAEGFYGEIDDILYAYTYLALQPYVDPNRIYLGGHSTGGTLVMLAAAADEQAKFRGIFSFGPVMATNQYGDFLFGGRDMATVPDIEIYLRAPILWLKDVQTPLYVIEGTESGNVADLRDMRSENKNPLVKFIEVDGHGHFDILAPLNELIASKILSQPQVTLTSDEVAAKMKTQKD